VQQQLRRFRKPQAIEPGMHVRWMGEPWTVEEAYYHPRWGCFFRVRHDENGRYELINSNGNDGGLEVFEAA